jgi:hypothetical protein
MIRLPHRSVTRFFIPLIDVLILLFCIYLLMPLVQGPADTAAGAEGGAAEGTGGSLSERERRELERLRRENAALRKQGNLTETERQEVERLRREKIEVLEQRLAVRVLEIDADTGKLYYYDPERVEVPDEAAARALIERQKRDAGSRDLYYLILFPRKLTGYPEERQVRQYDRWFQGVAHAFDNPRADRP